MRPSSLWNSVLLRGVILQLEARVFGADLIAEAQASGRSTCTCSSLCAARTCYPQATWLCARASSASLPLSLRTLNAACDEAAPHALNADPTMGTPAGGCTVERARAKGPRTRGICRGERRWSKFRRAGGRFAVWGRGTCGTCLSPSRYPGAPPHRR